MVETPIPDLTLDLTLNHDTHNQGRTLVPITNDDRSTKETEKENDNDTILTNVIEPGAPAEGFLNNFKENDNHIVKKSYLQQSDNEKPKDIETRPTTPLDLDLSLNLETSDHELLVFEDDAGPSSKSTTATKNNKTSNDNDVDQATIESENIKAQDDNLSKENDIAVVKIEPVPVFQMGRANSVEFDEILQDPEDIQIDHEVTMTILNGAMPKPLPSTIDDLIKRENDKFSSGKPYTELVS